MEASTVVIGSFLIAIASLVASVVNSARKANGTTVTSIELRLVKAETDLTHAKALLAKAEARIRQLEEENDRLKEELTKLIDKLGS